MKKLTIVLSALLIMTLATGCASTDYEDAQAEFERGNYDAAIELLESLGNYKDSNELLSEAKCLKAQQLSEAGQYTEALELLKNITNYNKASELLESIAQELHTAIINSSTEALSHIGSSIYGEAIGLQNYIAVDGSIAKVYSGCLAAQQDIKQAIDSIEEVIDFCDQYEDVSEVKSACDKLVALYEPILDLDISISASSPEEVLDCFDACESSSMKVIINELVPPLLLLKDGGTGELSINYNTKMGYIPYLSSAIEMLQK